MHVLFADLRYSLRRLRQAPGFTLTAILTLAFGIGATTAIFSIVDGVLLRPLPFAQPDRLVKLSDYLEGAGGDVQGTTARGVEIYARDTEGFNGLAGYLGTGFELSGAGEPAQINAARLTANGFPVLGTRPLLGRTWTQDEDNGRRQLAVLSYGAWRSRFGGDPHVLGRKIQLDRKPYEVIGVMPQGFEFPLAPGRLNQSELWVPMSLTEGELVQGAGNWNFGMVGRLKPGVSAAQAQTFAAPVSRELMRTFPAAMGSLRIHPVVTPLKEAAVAEARPVVRMLFLAVAFVLLIACANLAGLLLVRAVGRRRETAVRLALGANGAAILRQGLLETLTLSIAGGLLGLGLASTALRLGVKLLPETLPRAGAIRLDWPVAAFALLLAALTGLACGLAPALFAARTEVTDALKEGGRTGTGGATQARLRSGLVVGEVAVALVLLAAAGLLFRSYEKVRAVDLGFRADHALTASYSLPRQQYASQTAIDAFNEGLLGKLAQLPGVAAAGITSTLPAAGEVNNSSFVAEGFVPPKGEALQLAWPSQVMGGYFRAAGIRLLRGRFFTPADRSGSPFVVIVNRALVERYWPGLDPIGSRIHWGLPTTPLAWMTVVGEVGDVKDSRADAETRPQIYQPAGQATASIAPYAPPGQMDGSIGSIVVRGYPKPEAMEAALRCGACTRPTAPADASRTAGGRGCGRAGLAPLQHSPDHELRHGRSTARHARHLQRRRIFCCLARAGDGHPTGAWLAACAHRAAGRGFWSEARSSGLRAWIGWSRRCIEPAALAAVSGQPPRSARAACSRSGCAASRCWRISASRPVRCSCRAG